MGIKNQRGFTLIELGVTTAIAAIILIFSLPALLAKIEDAGMEGTGAYMAFVRVGLERYTLKNRDVLAAGTAQTLLTPALVNAYAPTIAELVRDKYITGSALTDITPQRQQIRTQITTPNCPGPNCTVIGLAYTTTPLLKTGTTNVRYDLLGTYLSSPAVAGFGLITKVGTNGATLAGSSGISLPNPVGAIPGIIGISTYLDESLYTSFVRRLDTRDPDLRGGLTVSGLLASGNTLEINGPTKLVGNTNITGNTTVTGIITAAAVGITTNGTLGASCTAPNTLVQGIVASMPVLLKCQGGNYVATGINIGVAGAGCTVESQFAQSVGGANLVCNNGLYRQVNDLFGRNGIMDVAVYSNGATVPTPTCGPSMTPVLIPMGVLSACVIGGGACLNNTGAFRGSINAGNVVSITGSNGASAGTAQMTVASLCSVS